ncbi:hypothetical protein K458DRAFT_413144 [Lentithecium fluviatile CBS 122367]|uniref:Aminoglycoside phosphotransferase domain-containing protein n=1 Tax=Lentithecium fluviatile CBS 122367 TaxID=1168545 RepID=A0A6G1JJG9_9PLEO|nr:hypothetical protein K458DRAFT_413144 [Lentithecium fluviatile CBS 122367]
MDPRFPLEGRDLSAVSDAEFVQAANIGTLISCNGTKIVRITSTAVLKIGFEVGLQEALNMEYVSTHSNGQIRVPHVYRTFTSKNIGYIAMDYIDGHCLDAIPWSERTTQERQNIVLQVTEGLRCIRSLRHCQPGPVGQGIPMGGIFTVYGAGRAFQTAADMEPWFNHKLGIIGAGDVTGLFKELVMCHMDISRRNLVLDKAGKLWFLDWAWAGFYPQAFEKASLLHKRVEDPDFQFAQDVLRELGYCSSEESLVGLLLSVFQVNDGPFQGSHLTQGC